MPFKAIQKHPNAILTKSDEPCGAIHQTRRFYFQVCRHLHPCQVNYPNNRNLFRSWVSKYYLHTRVT